MFFRKEVGQILRNRQLIFLLLFPPTMQLLLYGLVLNPEVRHYVTIVRGILLRGVGIEVLWPHALALGLIAMVLMGVSINRFRAQLS